MRVMSLNGWGGSLHAPLIGYLAQAQPDVLCLQEVVHSPATDLDWLTYRDGTHVLAQRANLYREVAQALPDHAGTFCPAASGVLWDGDAAIPSFWGLATFVHRRLIEVGQAQGFVHKSYSLDGYGDHPRARSAHAVRLHDGAARRYVSITHMHGLRDPAGKHDTPERMAQVQRFLALSDQVSARGDLRILCGDFNVEPGSETLAHLTARGFTDLVAAYGHTSTRTSHYTKPGRFADYMLINDARAVQRFEVVTSPEVSDHCPLVLRV